MEAGLIEKLKQGRPVKFTSDEEAVLTESLRAAMAKTLEIPKEDISDDAKIFDTLGLDSIDIFDILDQMAATFEVDVPLEELPESFLRGAEESTFMDFADGILRFFKEPPAVPPKGA